MQNKMYFVLVPVCCILFACSSSPVESDSNENKSSKSSVPSRIIVTDGGASSYTGASYTYSGTTYTIESAADAVAHFDTGWNLGNTLDSNSANNGWIGKYGTKNTDGSIATSAWETAWGQRVTTKAMIAKSKAAGFNAIRVPVSWEEHMSTTAPYGISDIWMNRVEEVVNYVLDNGMYCILNVHHDGGANGWVKANETYYNGYKDKFVSLWTQIGQRFNKYNGNLLFESTNEVLDNDDNNWSVSTSGIEYVNKLNQLFVDTVRATGGNNATRNLVVMTECGNSGSTALGGMTIPNDSTSGHIVVEVHNYDPQGFTTTDATWTKMYSTWSASDESTMNAEFDVMKNFSTTKNIPLIIGEYAAFRKKCDNDSTKYNDSDRAAYAKFFVENTYTRGIKCFWWDTGELFDRTKDTGTDEGTWASETVLDGIKSGLSEAKGK